MKSEITRRNFLGKAALGAAGAAAAMSARSYGRVVGANDRINIGFVGCGKRNGGHRNMVEMSWKDKNLGVVAVCDLWNVRAAKAAADCKSRFSADVKPFKYLEDMLQMPELDAVMIATGDHQHAKLLAEIVQAGKHCYCEKPMAIDVEEAKLARAAVLNSDRVVQMGSQWISNPYHIAVRDMVRSGKLGQITKIEQVWGDNDHRWHIPDRPEVKAIREEDTDWNRWLLGKPYRPFDPRAYFEFRIFRDFSGGITSQWLSHGIGLAHFYTDTAIPDTMVANGGIFAWPDIRQNPDTFQALATFNDAKLLYSYSSSYGNLFGDYNCIRGKSGTLYSQGGEGSPRWFFIPEHIGENLYGGFAEAIKTGRAQLVTPEGFKPELPPTKISDDSKYHMDDWIDSMRNPSRKTYGHIHTGFWHSIGAIMATRAYREGRKLYWDRKNEEIIETPPPV